MAARSDNDRIAFGIAVVITGAWTISFLVDIVVETYDPSPSVHALMMIVAGAVFGEGLFRRTRHHFPSSPDAPPSPPLAEENNDA